MDDLKGIYLRPVNFEPTSGKWQGETCHGFQIHVTSPEEYNSYETSLRILQSIIKNHSNHFAFKRPPYEYEFDKMPMDLILGSSDLRQKIETLEDLDEVFLQWQTDLDQFKRFSEGYYQYGK